MNERFHLNEYRVKQWLIHRHWDKVVFYKEEGKFNIVQSRHIVVNNTIILSRRTFHENGILSKRTFHEKGCGPRKGKERY